MHLNNDNRPYIRISINGKIFVGLLDSGAQATVAGVDFENCAEELGLEFSNTNSVIKTADGSKHVVSKTIKLPICLNGKIKNIHALYAPFASKELILGCDFWQSFDIRPVLCSSLESQKISPVCDAHIIPEKLIPIFQNVLQMMPFAKEGTLSETHLISHHINTGDNQPLKQKHYVVSPYIQKSINGEIDRLLELDVVEKCNSSPWSNPIVAVKKPNGNVRICLDARKLNALTVKDAYPHPQINRILGQISGTKILSSIDFSDAFLQVPLDHDSRPKTAFAVSGRGLFQYKRMPFGLCNSGATLCRLVDNVIGCDLEPHVFVYLDDIIVMSKTYEEHFEILKKLAIRIKEAGLTISPEKSRFCMKSLKYLGFVLDEQGIRPDPDKVKAIIQYSTPKNVKDVRRLLGMAGWYQRFVPKYASITAPLTDLLKKNKMKFLWSDAQENAFMEIKQCLMTSPILANPDYSQKFIIQTDASAVGIAAILVQGEGQDERIICYYSQKLSKSQQSYPTTERECLAVLTAIEKFRPYIEGSTFTVVTDHASLKWLQTFKDPTGRINRWSLRLQAYDFDIVHRKGTQMVVADALSRSVDVVEVSTFPDETDEWYTKLCAVVSSNSLTYDIYRLENGILYRNCALRNDPENWLIVVPTGKRENVLQDAHDDPMSAHGGYAKTLDKIKRRFYWPRMYVDVKKYVGNCDVCKASKPTNVVQTAPMGRFKEVSRPWQMLHMDFIGPLPRSKGGYCYIFVVVDAMSKFVHIHPLRTATSKAIIRFLEDRIFLTFGVPETIISDNGSQFISTEFRKFLEKYKVKFWPTAIYHPQANAAEAANKTVSTSIRCYIKDGQHHREWDQHLSEIACAMNDARHGSTKYSPYFVNFGQFMSTSGDFYSTNINKDSPDESSRNEHFSKVRAMVKRNLEKSFEIGKNRYNLRSRPIEYVIGETVWKKNKQQSDALKGQSKKLFPKFIKCVVSRKVGSNTYEIVDSNGKQAGIVSTKLLKK